MYLSNLTLFGFKSFVDRVSIDFQSGVTALVGPNGCGKSNILDAIRWVLGEQSSKALRGNRMEDLIFAGNTHRKPVGMAEISLTLSDIQGKLAVPYDEVTITRRLYRSGESEYLLNQNPCRLKDITHLFLDTGLGREPYALIEQGAIGSLLNARPVDRRALLEETAGTMSYKVRRNTALGRLEAAEHNLLRVNDVLQELERQRTSLHRQAKKAERYQRLTRRLREIQALLLLTEDRRLGEELHRVIHEDTALAEAQTACQLRASTEETSLETGRLQDQDLEKRISAAQERLYSLRSQREREEADVRSREAMLQDLRQRAEEHLEGLRAAGERLHHLVQDLEADAKMRARTEEELEGASGHLRQLNDALAAVEGELRESEEALERQKGEILALTERLVDQRNQVASLTERRRLLRQERETLERQLAASQAEAQAVTGREHELTARLQDLDTRIGNLTGEEAALAEELSALEARQQSLGDQRAGLREKLSGLEGRLNSLQELEASLAGLNEGQQFLLKGKTGGVPICQTIEGPLSRFVRVEAAWEKAVEALLGDLQQGLLTPSAADALDLLQYLEREGTGWATLLPREEEWLAVNGEPGRLQEALKAAEAPLDPAVARRVIGPALRLVKAPEELQPLLRALLGDAVIVQDLPTALVLLRSLRCPARVATASGAVLSSRGPIQGGNTIALSLLSRRRELEELPAVVGRVAEELHAMEGEWETAQETLLQRQHARRLQEQARRETEAARHEVERSLAEVRTVASRLANQIEFLTSELARLEKELSELAPALQGTQTNVEAWGRQEESLKAEAAERDQQVTRFRVHRQEVQRDVAEVRIRMTSLHERREALHRSIERLEADLSRERTHEAALRQEEEEGRSREATLAEEIVALRQSHGVLQQQEEQEAHAVQKLQGERDHLRHTLLAHEEALRAARKELTDIQQQQATIATRRTALSTERSLLQKRLQEEIPEAEHLRDRLQEGDPSQDPETLTQEGDELRQKIATMGPINMAALEEYESLSERHRFLTDQAADLTASTTSLKATIAEINRTIQDRFTETVAAVNEHLDRFWRQLFHGGEAELVLSEDAEAEEPGVEIRVRIPGKRMTTLSLLSGGEKTLGAIALLMALWATKPSPFVVLDEVDAALDDVNVDRFASLVRELAPTSQFILMTHNPRTIEVASLLYGITMQEPGVSRLISVRLGQQAEQAAPATAP
ncbi:MAG: chromosome segregation protein SMC [Candidatus Methylomirabilales bacterium]